MTPQNQELVPLNIPDLNIPELEPGKQKPEARKRAQVFIPNAGPLGIGGALVDLDSMPEPFRSLSLGLLRGSTSSYRNIVGTLRMLGLEGLEEHRKSLGESIANLPPSPALEEIGSVWDGVKWLAGLAGEQAPNVALTGTGFAAAGPIGAAAASYLLNAGETYNNLRDRGVDPKMASVASGLVGAGKTALDLVVPIRIASDSAKKTVWLPASRVLGSPTLRKVLTSDPVIEGGTEAAQEVLDIVAELGFGVNKPEQNLSRILNSFVAGAVTEKIYAPLIKTPEPRNSIDPATTDTQPGIRTTTRIAGLSEPVSESTVLRQWNLSSPKKIESLLDARLLVQVKPGLYQYERSVVVENDKVSAVVGKSSVVPSKTQDVLYANGKEIHVDQLAGLSTPTPVRQVVPGDKEVLTEEEAKAKLGVDPAANTWRLVQMGLLEPVEGGQFRVKGKALEDGRLVAPGDIIINPQDNNAVTIPGGVTVTEEEFMKAVEETGSPEKAVEKLHGAEAPVVARRVRKRPTANEEVVVDDIEWLEGEPGLSPARQEIQRAIASGEQVIYDATNSTVNGIAVDPAEVQDVERDLKLARSFGDAEIVGLRDTEGRDLSLYRSTFAYTGETSVPLALAVRQDTVTAEESDYSVPVDIRSNGEIVGTTRVLLHPDKFAGARVPASISVEIGPTGKSENLPGLITEAVTRTVLEPAVEAARRGVAEAYDNAGPVFDEFSQLDSADMNPKTKQALQIVAGRIANTLGKMKGILLSSRAYLNPKWAAVLDRIDLIGATITHGFIGSALIHPETGRIKIYINPFLPHDTVAEMFNDVYATLLHELAHGVSRGQGEEFWETLRDAIEAFDDVKEQIYSLIESELGSEEEGSDGTQLIKKEIEFATTVFEEQVLSDAKAKPIPGVLHSTRDVDYARRQIAIIREGKDAALVGKARERLQAALIANPDILRALLADPDIAAWAEQTLEGIQTNPDGTVLVYRSHVPGSRTWGTDVYLTRNAAVENARKFWSLVHTKLESLKQTVAKKAAGWMTIGKSTFQVVKEENGEFTLRDRRGFVLIEGGLEHILGELRSEIEHLKTYLAKQAEEVTGHLVPRDMLKLRIGNTIFSEQTPTLRERIVSDALVPRLKRDKEGVDKDDKEAVALAAKFEAMTKQWTEYERKSGLDSIGRFFRYSLRFRTLLQLVQRLPGFTPLALYYKGVESYWQTKTQVLEKANAILEEWIKIGYADGQILGRVLINVTKKSFTERMRLTEEQVVEEIKKAHGDPEKLYPLFVKIDEMFRESGRALLDALESEARKIYKDPAVVEIYLARYKKLRDDIENRNYFPLARFGKFAVTAKSNGKLVSFESFTRQSQADARAKQLKAEDPTLYVQRILIGDAAAPLLMFPPALFDYLVAHLGLNTEQIQQLREIQQVLNPSAGFSKHYLRRSMVPGEDADAMAGFADYFQHYSNHLARVTHRYELETQLRVIDEVSSNVTSGYEVGAIRDLLKRHFQDLMNPSNDLASLRAGLFLYMFAFLPAAAVINLTQVPIYTYPYLAKRLGNDVKAAKFMGEAVKKLLAAKVKGPDALTEWERRMLEEGVKAGVIEESFVSTIAQFASKDTLQSYWEGYPRVGYYLHKIGNVAIAAFHGAEVYNRQVTFLTALYTAKALGIVDEEAMLEFAKDAVRNTQFEYAYFNRPEIFRGGKGIAQLKPLIAVFKMFLQGHLYFAFSNQGGWRFWMMLVALAGIKGAVPFSEDILNILNALGTFLKLKLGLKNPKVDLEEAARKFLAKVGANPDLVLKGLSRYGFGLGLAQSLFGLPFPAFDLSNMLSMQEILPAIKPITQAMLGETDAKEAMHEAFFRTLGAAFTTGVGAGASLLDTVSGKPNASVRWAPRQLQYLLKAYRAARSGYYTSSTGQPLAKIDMRDPAHVAELVAYAMGAQPTRLVKSIEEGVVAREHVAFYEAWKERIVTEFVLGIAQKDPKLRKDAIMDLRKYQKMAPPEMRFRGSSFQDSVKERLMNRKLSEMGLPPQKRYWRFFREFQHPGP